MKQLDEYIKEVGEWAKYNFDASTHLPQLGVAEEIGELTHVILKRIQSIRKKGDYSDDIKDALGDAAVYLCHWWHLHGRTPAEARLYSYSMFGALADLHIHAGYLIHETYMNTKSASERTNTIWAGLEYIASLERLGDLIDILDSVWAEVRKRDWRKFPTNGLTE